jgi:hypothetical protein
MRIGVIAVTAATLLVSGCATVDMTDMAVPAAKTETVAEKNVVQRAASRLYAAFTSRGFAPKSSRKRMQSAASVLLNGLQERDLRDTDVKYAEQELPASVVKADILYAANHVSQTTKAAEVYFEMVPAKRNLRKELASLEQALLASREASALFAKTANADAADIAALDAEIAALKSVTDVFGQRVRQDAARDMSERRAEETS